MAESKRQKVEVSADDEAKIEKLRAVQQQIENLTNQSLEEIMEVEKRYGVRKRPLYNQRRQVAKQVPNFWLTVVSTS
jgi:hypothetical protein